ncbi:MAG TPA: MarC family protein [Candidatus Bathyarchaeia archaeon]|nr:MarC family protein [Candidatus Bathyarchaeia archaeon]
MLNRLPFVQAVLFVVGALLPIVNPFGNAPIFLALTAGVSRETHAALARLVALYGFALLVVSLFVGSYILEFFGVTVPAMRVAGGIVVIATGWNILHRSEAPSGQGPVAWSEHEIASRAFYPLTLPLTVGPGSISVAVTLGADMPVYNLPTPIIATVGLVGVALVCVSVYLAYRYADALLRFLGETGTDVLVRLSAFILLCIGVEITWKGVTALLVPLLHGAAAG